jgi:hypothetical protein
MSVNERESSEPAPNACAECRYFRALPEKTLGECRRYPPSGGSPLAVFPLVLPPDWCGEWLPLEPADA